MKNLYLGAALICLFALPAQAQLKLGVKAGLNLASVNAVYKGDKVDFSEFKNRPSFNAGVLAAVPVLPKFAFQAEALLSGKGGKIEAENSLPESSLQLYYISVPLMAVFKPVEAIGLQAGVELNYLVSAKNKVNDQSFDVEDVYKDKDVGLLVGAQATFQRINIDARYIYGITKINELTFTDANGVNISTVKLNNSVFQVAVGYLLLK